MNWLQELQIQEVVGIATLALLALLVVAMVLRVVTAPWRGRPVTKFTLLEQLLGKAFMVGWYGLPKKEAEVDRGLVGGFSNSAVCISQGGTGVAGYAGTSYSVLSQLMSQQMASQHYNNSLTGLNSLSGGVLGNPFHQRGFQ